MSQTKIVPILPPEVWNIIWDFYWKDIYTNKVIAELKSPYKVGDEVYIYMCKNGMYDIIIRAPHFTDPLHNLHFMEQNIKLKKILGKKSGIFLFCQSQETSYNNMVYILYGGLLNNIHDKYKYICAFYILFAGHDSFPIINYFENITII
jgi:hypothetical protein